jgi:hypothetical protein
MIFYGAVLLIVAIVIWGVSRLGVVPSVLVIIGQVLGAIGLILLVIGLILYVVPGPGIQLHPTLDKQGMISL